MRINCAWMLLRSEPPRLSEADAMLSRAHEALTEMAFAPLLAACETEMAWSALLRGEPAQAADLAKQAGARCGDPATVELQNARVVAGLAQIVAGEPDAGAEIAGDAAARLAVIGSHLEAAQAWRDLADALIQQGRSAQAIQALQRAADCAGLRSSAIGAPATPATPATHALLPASS
jgi:ATP/maltotriose-dependent transcriptional regulator MalT